MSKVCFVIDINMPAGSTKSQCTLMGYKIKNLLSTLKTHSDWQDLSKTCPGSLVVCTDQLYTRLLATVTSCFLCWPRTELVLSDASAESSMAGKSYTEQYGILSTLKGYLAKCTYCGESAPVPQIQSYFPQGQVDAQTENALSAIGVQNVGFMSGRFNVVTPNATMQDNLIDAFDSGQDLIIYIDVQQLPYPYEYGVDCNYAGLGPVIDHMKAGGAKFVTMGEFYSP